MIVIAGGTVVLPDRTLTNASLLLDGDRIGAIEVGRRLDPAGAEIIDARDCYVVPGFIDVHVHGVEGHDTLDGGNAIAMIASRLPRYGVTSFAPTTVACPPGELRQFLEQVRAARTVPKPDAARVLPAHMESNFINPDYCGAQPLTCLRLPPGASGDAGRRSSIAEGEYSASDILDAIAAFRPDVGTVTLAPELPGAIDLVRALVAADHQVSIGHSGADFETAIAAIEAGASRATHLFNRMTPLAHRAPGLAGAVLAREDVAAELICDGHHVHPAMSQMAIAAKGIARVMAITDGTAGSGLPVGASARLGGRTIHVRDEAAVLDDGTLAGSTLTMDRAFRTIVTSFGRSIVDAAVMCSTTPARELGLTGFGVLTEGAVADIAILDRNFRVTRTFINGRDVGVRPQ